MMLVRRLKFSENPLDSIDNEVTIIAKGQFREASRSALFSPHSPRKASVKAGLLCF
jgi:hypothetical protein